VVATMGAPPDPAPESAGVAAPASVPAPDPALVPAAGPGPAATPVQATVASAVAPEVASAPPVADPASVPPPNPQDPGVAQAGVAAVPAVPDAPAAPVSGAPIDPKGLALSEPEAMRLLLALWGVNLKDLGPGDPCERLPAYGLRCERDRGTWRELHALDMPALLKLRPERGRGREATYLVLTGLDADSVALAHAEGTHRVPRADLKQILSGSYTVVWQPPPVGAAIISSASRGEPVRWLRKLLSQVPELGVTDTESGTFDAAVGAALRRFQVKYGLHPDGMAGAKTLIQLNNAVGMPGIPKLSKGP